MTLIKRSLSISILFSFWLAFAGMASLATGQNTDNVNGRGTPTLAVAKSKLASSKRQYEATQRLRKKGSASGSELRKKKLAYLVARLEFETAQNPNIKIENETAIAKLKFQYRTAERKIGQRLFDVGSISEHDLKQRELAESLSKFNLRIHEEPANEKLFRFQIVKERFEFAAYELKKAKRLNRKGYLSRHSLDQINAQYLTAKSQLDQSKKSLGGKAYRVKQ